HQGVLHHGQLGARLPQRSPEIRDVAHGEAAEVREEHGLGALDAGLELGDLLDLLGSRHGPPLPRGAGLVPVPGQAPAYLWTASSSWPPPGRGASPGLPIGKEKRLRTQTAEA